MNYSRHTETFVWVCIILLSILFCLNLTPWSRAGDGNALDEASRIETLEVAAPEDGSAGISPVPVSVPPHDAHFIEAIVQVESRGRTDCVGLAGERGLMQIQESTWYEVTRNLFEEEIPFDSAFDPALNRQVGAAYLDFLYEFLSDRRNAWDGRTIHTMLAACYNAGPTCVARADFELERLPAVTQSYVERVTALYEFYLRREDL